MSSVVASRVQIQVELARTVGERACVGWSRVVARSAQFQRFQQQQRTFITRTCVNVNSEADRAMKRFLAIWTLMFLFLMSSFLPRRRDRGQFALRLLIVMCLARWTREMGRAIRRPRPRLLVDQDRDADEVSEGPFGKPLNWKLGVG